jgi:hypothetical protein
MDYDKNTSAIDNAISGDAWHCHACPLLGAFQCGGYYFGYSGRGALVDRNNQFHSLSQAKTEIPH